MSASFKEFLEKDHQEIDQPFYRIVSPMHGAGAKRNNIEATGKDTYWTPRWDAILLMVQSNYTHSMMSRDDWPVKIYKVTKAIMKPAPKEHKWAFNYATDAGEMVLVKALEGPEIVFDGKASELEPLVDDSLYVQAPINHARHSVPATYRGQKVYLSPNYKTQEIDVMKPHDWSFKQVASIKSLKELEQFQKENEVDWEGADEEGLALHYAISDFGWLN